MSDSETYSSDESESDDEVVIKKVLPIVRNKMEYDDDEEEEEKEKEEDEDDDDDDYAEKKKDDVSKIIDSDDDFDEEDDEDEDEDEDEDDEEKTLKKTSKKQKLKDSGNIQNIPPILFGSDDEYDEEDEEDDKQYLQKFDISVNKNYVNEFHPECVSHNFDEIAKLSNIVRDDNGNIIDPFHKTIPFLTKYERARVLGQRAKQIETGSKPLVKVPDNIIDGYIIADLELEQKKIPFIIRRPLPNGASEYWRLVDLQVIAF
jgi:DNA-directed RNA polymerase subunit K/omega